MYIAGLLRLFPVQIRRALVQNFLLGSVKFSIYATQNQNITTITAKNIYGVLLYDSATSALGPVLSLLYVADVIELVKECGLIPHAFADDLQIYGHSVSADTQKLVGRMTTWSARSGTRLPVALLHATDLCSWPSSITFSWRKQTAGTTVLHGQLWTAFLQFFWSDCLEWYCDGSDLVLCTVVCGLRATVFLHVFR